MEEDQESQAENETKRDKRKKRLDDIADCVMREMQYPEEMRPVARRMFELLWTAKGHALVRVVQYVTETLDRMGVKPVVKHNAAGGSGPRPETVHEITESLQKILSEDE